MSQSADPINPLASWGHASSDIATGGLSRTRKASADECRALEQALRIPSVASLEASYRIAGLSGGGYKLSGDIKADVVQACVVTLEPVPALVADRFNVEFWSDPASREEKGDQSVLEGADVEPLIVGQIDVGRIVFETLSGGLNPYPRKQGAEFGWQDPALAKPELQGPFAALAKFKPGS